MEQQEFDLDFKDRILCKLQKDDKPLSSTVIQDDLTKIATNNFDYKFDGKIEFYGYKFPKKLENLEFNILCIVGQSGSGKSTFANYFRVDKEEELKWDNSKAIISHFKDENDAISRLSSVGLNSIPTWLKPRNVLSVGEGFRVDLARSIKDNCVIDEFTSTVDRTIAKNCSMSIQKYIRKNNIKKCVFVSCHKDFIDYIQPDYVVDLDDECVYDTREIIPRRKIKLQFYEEKDKKGIWKIFGKHHYLTQQINYACRIFSFRLNDTPIAIVCILPLPNGLVPNLYRIHRIVVLPEFQSLGIGKELLILMCKILKSNGKRPFIRTSHINMINFLNKNDDFKISKSRSGKFSPSLFNEKYDVERIAYSYEYIGEEKLSGITIPKISSVKNDNVEQLKLF